MAYGNQRQKTVRTDRFGNPNVLVRMKQQTNRKTNETMPIFAGFVELGGKLYKVEVSPNNKEYPDGVESRWLKVTHLKERGKASI